MFLFWSGPVNPKCQLSAASLHYSKGSDGIENLLKWGLLQYSHQPPPSPARRVHIIIYHPAVAPGRQRKGSYPCRAGVPAGRSHFKNHSIFKPFKFDGGRVRGMNGALVFLFELVWINRTNTNNLAKNVRVCFSIDILKVYT